jgi:cell division protein ZapE
MNNVKLNPQQNPIEVYQSLLKAEILSVDASQMNAMNRLQDLNKELITYLPKFENKDWWARFNFGQKRTHSPSGVYIWGGVGRGKSMLMDLFFENTTADIKRKRVHFHSFMQKVHQDLFDCREAAKLSKIPNSLDPIEEVGLAISQSAWLLCFDEFHITDIADAMILGRLFEILFDQGVIVVATSNRPPKDLYKDGLQRELFLPFINMIEKYQDIIHLDNGIDYRLNRLNSMDVYLTPADTTANLKLNKNFKELSIGSTARPVYLTIKEREIKIPYAAEGVAMATFFDLCSQPLGPSDYLEIASCFHTLILKNIPKLGPEKRDEAKRFVTLIDALYEAKVNFICSAEVSPKLLYTEGDGDFEFNRTVSRLIEMQSTEYHALAHVS